VDPVGFCGCQVDAGVAQAGGEEKFEVRELREEVGREGGALAHAGDDGEGFEAVDQLLLYILGSGRVVEGEEGVAEDGDGEGGIEGCEVRFCDSLVVVEDGDFDWGWGNGRHSDGSARGQGTTLTKSQDLCSEEKLMV